jgi:RNA polymerase sigma-70 factor (ECF subfamily)
MGEAASMKTSPTLLGRLRLDPLDQGAWEQFVGRYGRTIYRWCRTWGLQEADAEDVTQNVLTELARQMRTFAYRPEGSFRAWLKTVSHRAWCDFLGSRQRALRGTGDTAVLNMLRSVESRRDLLEHLDNEYDRELLEQAIVRVRLRVQPRTWDAFRMTAIEDMSAADVASQLGMKPGAIYVARSKVQKMIQEEMAQLDRDHTRSRP